MSKKKKILAASGAAIGSVVLLNPGVAHADQWRDTAVDVYGGRADCTVETFPWQGWVDAEVVLRCNVDDTANDGDSLYIDWYHNNSGVIRIEGPVDTDWPTHDSAVHIPQVDSVGYRLCRNDWPFSDPCSEWRNYAPDGRK
jgi:hypothetical protein